MTSQSPRIYLYKITFEEVPYYYYGVHKEKYFNEEYWGSPVTHKWMWDFYTPKKQVLEIFEFSDAGWLEARKIEIRIIKPVLNDKWCLNENCGGIMSLDVARKSGIKSYELGLGFHSLSKEQRVQHGKNVGEWNKENTSKEFCVISPEGVIINGKNVREFCRRENLNRGNFMQLLNGSWKQYKGWKLAF